MANQNREKKLMADQRIFDFINEEGFAITTFPPTLLQSTV
jgi:hypothetical protein